MSFYPGSLIRRYYVDPFLCPEKHTTIMDFLKTYENSQNHYDIIIAHVGIVDFSPRHQSTALNEIYKIKKDWYDRIFGEANMLEYLNSNLGIKYEGDNTINMFSLQMAENRLIPYLNNIPNLIFIGCNNFVKGWQGNYFKPRPENISLVDDYSRLFCSNLHNAIDLSDWSDTEVKLYTYDNLHLTPEGGGILLSRIVEKIRHLEKK